MEILVSIVAGFVSVLFFIFGLFCVFANQDETKKAKEAKKEAEQITQALNNAVANINQEKIENEEKITQAHSGNNLHNADAVFDLLRK